MKNLLRILILALAMPIAANAQELEENQVDEFTKKTVKRTSWETLCSVSGFSASFNLHRVDSMEVMHLKVMLGGKVFAVDQGDNLILLASDGETVTLRSPSFVLSCTGCGAVGFMGSSAEGASLVFEVPKEAHQALKTKSFTKVRLYTTKGYAEADIKPKAVPIINKAASLVE